ncbi:MAG: hypothetical protein GTN49_02275 [candidate division Zixibacteria bacterium]|nr:hypothetical protein [candidate division Zixibacteria bacterium]
MTRSASRRRPSVRLRRFSGNCSREFRAGPRGPAFLYLITRGFAVTLTIGILASTFTAIVVTKSIFDYFTGRRVKRLYIG